MTVGMHMHDVPRRLSNQGEKLRGAGLDGGSAIFSPPAGVCCQGDDRAATRLFSWEGNPAAQVPLVSHLPLA